MYYKNSLISYNMCCGGSQRWTPGKKKEWVSVGVGRARASPRSSGPRLGSAAPKAPGLACCQPPRTPSAATQSAPSGLTAVTPQPREQTNKLRLTGQLPSPSRRFRKPTRFSHSRGLQRARGSVVAYRKENLAEDICSFVPTHVHGLLTLLGDRCPSLSDSGARRTFFFFFF